MDYHSVFILPWDKQCETLIASTQARAERFLVVTDNMADPAMLRNARNLKVLDVEEFLATADEFLEVPWMPVSEVSFYCLTHNDLYSRARLSFDEKMASVITKLQTESVLRELCIDTPKNALFSRTSPAELSYPCVSKPNFSFASLFTRRIQTVGQMEDHASVYRSEVHGTLIAHYYGKYLNDASAPNAFELLIQPDYSDLIFASVSVIVQEGRVHAVLPVFGAKHEASSLSDFQWRQAYVPRTVPELLTSSLFDAANRLVQGFHVSRGVISFEALIDFETAHIRVLEFEARTMGSWITMLVEHGYGIDVDRLAFELFLDPGATVPPMRRQPVVGVRAAGESGTWKGLTPLQMYARVSVGVPLMDTIYRLDDVENVSGKSFGEP